MKTYIVILISIFFGANNARCVTDFDLLLSAKSDIKNIEYILTEVLSIGGSSITTLTVHTWASPGAGRVAYDLKGSGGVSQGKIFIDTASGEKIYAAAGIAVRAADKYEGKHPSSNMLFYNELSRYATGHDIYSGGQVIDGGKTSLVFDAYNWDDQPGVWSRLFVNSKHMLVEKVQIFDGQAIRCKSMEILSINEPIPDSRLAPPHLTESAPMSMKAVMEMAERTGANKGGDTNLLANLDRTVSRLRDMLAHNANDIRTTRLLAVTLCTRGIRSFNKGDISESERIYRSILTSAGESSIEQIEVRLGLARALASADVIANTTANQSAIESLVGDLILNPQLDQRYRDVANKFLSSFRESNQSGNMMNFLLSLEWMSNLKKISI